MKSFSRRGFLGAAGAACMVSASRDLGALTAAPAAISSYPVQLGLVTKTRRGEDPQVQLERVKRLGFSNCQMSFEGLTLEVAGPLRRAMDKTGIRVTAVMELGPGPKVWDFYHGPLTIGLIPPSTRQARIAALKLAADVAEATGIECIHTHCGFIPEDPNSPIYPQAVAAIKEVAVHAREKGRLFLCETGQETPITLLRMFDDVGIDCLRVNLDTANLILYGKGNPSDAIDVIGKYVHGMHAKDGLFPTDPKELGKEVPIGQGKVNFHEVLHKLKALDYHGPMTIEREIQGPRQEIDIDASRTYLTGVITGTYS